MTFSYSFHNADHTYIVKKDELGTPIMYISVDTRNPLYTEFLASGAEAAPYVAPPEPEPPTAEEKIASAGLTPNPEEIVGYDY